MLFATIENIIKVPLGKRWSSAIIIGLCCALSATAQAKVITPLQTVEQALAHSPKLNASVHQQQAAQFDLQQARNSYLPSVDLKLGYGIDQHSDDVTRRNNADPSDTDWDSRSDASITLTQNLYTGGETGHQIKIREALLESSQKQQGSIRQSVILDALTAHLEVFRQRELVDLAQANFDVHQDIYQSLEERARAGSGNLADVSQAQARLARAQTTLFFHKSELVKAVVGYARLIGISPEPQQLSYVETPVKLPASLENALQLMEQQNPDLMALKTTLDEAQARVGLAEATFKPKLDLQLSSRYADKIEGEQSWQNTNEAMINLRWNLFNGGQDKAGKQAALARKLQNRSAWEDKLFELRETTAATWETYQSLKVQKTAYRDAAKFSRSTFDAYLSQFSVSQRSLLDILSAENDYFQAASQLINVTVNETITAYRLLALTGELFNLQFSGAPDKSEIFDWLTQRPDFTPSAEANAEIEAEPAAQTVEESLTLFVERWAERWAEQDVSGYLGCYSEQFVPEKGRNYEVWQNARRVALTKPAFIKLAISDLEVLERDDQRYQAIFIQDYQSNRYQDRVRKTLTFERVAEEWKIVREQAVPFPEVLTPRLPASSAVLEPDPQESIDYTLEIGPCVTAKDLALARKALSDLALEYARRTASGSVKFVRLYEGSYPQARANQRLEKVREAVASAYLLPDQNQKLGLYMGSFRERARAENFSEKLRGMGIETTLVETELEMPGEFLRISGISHSTGEKLVEQMKVAGLPVRAVE